MKTVKKILKISGVVFLLFVVILGIHIYIVTKPKPADARTLAMTRIDFKQPINQNDADKIQAWLYRQKGVNHVVCNAKWGNAVFTYYALSANPNKITTDLTTDLNYQAVRYIPSEKEMASGCPISKTSFTYRVYTYFKSI